MGNNSASSPILDIMEHQSAPTLICTCTTQKIQYCHPFASHAASNGCEFEAKAWQKIIRTFLQQMKQYNSIPQLNIKWQNLRAKQWQRQYISALVKATITIEEHINNWYILPIEIILSQQTHEVVFGFSAYYLHPKYSNGRCGTLLQLDITQQWKVKEAQSLQIPFKFLFNFFELFTTAHQQWEPYLQCLETTTTNIQIIPSNIKIDKNSFIDNSMFHLYAPNCYIVINGIKFSNIRVTTNAIYGTSSEMISIVINLSTNKLVLQTMTSVSYDVAKLVFNNTNIIIKDPLATKANYESKIYFQLINNKLEVKTNWTISGTYSIMNTLQLCYCWCDMSTIMRVTFGEKTIYYAKESDMFEEGPKVFIPNGRSIYWNKSMAQTMQYLGFKINSIPKSILSFHIEKICMNKLHELHFSAYDNQKINYSIFINNFYATYYVKKDTELIYMWMLERHSDWLKQMLQTKILCDVLFENITMIVPRLLKLFAILIETELLSVVLALRSSSGIR